MSKEKFDVCRIQGGDTVRLKSGKVIRVEDIHNKMIVVMWDERYPIDDVVEIVTKFKG